METKKNKDGSISYKEKVYLENGRTITQTFKNKTLAKNWKRDAESEKARNRALGIAPLKENMKFEDFITLWMESKIVPVRSSKTIADYRSMSRKHFIPAFGQMPLRSFERSHADELIKRIVDEKRTPKTVNKVLATFKQIFLFAEADGYLSKSPFKHFQRLKVMMGRVDFLTSQEILQLLRANATEDVYDLLVVALNTGMRIGELTGLCWDRVNFERNYLEISRAQTREGLKNSTKTHLVRHIPMNEEVLKTMKKLISLQESSKYVFTKANREPFNPDHFSKRYFEPALDRANVRKINFHILRHTYASQFMMNGGNIYSLQSILGHTNVTMTMKYAHLSPTHLQGVVEFVRFSADGNKSVSPFSAPRKKSEEEKEDLSY